VEPFLTRLVEDLEADRSHCHLLYYIFSHDSVGQRVAEALIHAARRGVTCRLLVDAAGSRPVMKSKLWGEMRDAGVKLGVALPVNPLRAFVARLDLRNHRKLTVIDGRVAYAGSHNISRALYYKKERFGAWVDASVRLTGATVQLLQELFIQDWYATTGELPDDEDLFPRFVGPSSSNIPIQVLPTGPASEDAPLERVILQAIHVAEEHVGLTTPYFVPDDALVDALRAAAWRGVEVDLVVPKVSDAPVVQAAGRSRYGELLEVGVRIYEYTAGLLHAKTVTVDHAFSLIGSANLDIRSFMLNFELALLVYDEDFASQVQFLRRSYIQSSEEVTLWDWRSRGPRKVLFDNVSKLVSPLL
jgi:cardiolipin synthase